jgi:hypothetical protein
MHTLAKSGHVLSRIRRRFWIYITCQRALPSRYWGLSLAPLAWHCARAEGSISGRLHQCSVPLRALTHRTMAANLLTATPIEAAIIIAATLADPRDLLRLAVALPRRFATKCIAAPAAHRNFEGGGAAAIEMWSIAEEVARRWIVTCTDQERGWVPRRGQESWLGLMWEVQSLRRGAAVLGRSHEHITLFEGGSRATKASGIFEYRAAASKAVMRAGRHYVQFAVVSGPHRSVCDIMLGVTAVEGGDDAYRVDGHCFYNTWGGSCFPGTGRACRAQRRATASACSSTSTRAA